MSEAISRSAAQPVTITVRPEVARFAELMEQKLADNDHKPHWRESLSTSEAYLRLMQESTELLGALLQGDPDAIVDEAIDIANFAMMIADLVEGETENVRHCRVCGCTDDDCSQCIERTGEPCYWVEWDLCSACATETAEAGVADR